jgi:hypothetical protein
MPLPESLRMPADACGEVCKMGADVVTMVPLNKLPPG